MKKIFLLSLVSSFFFACSFKNQITYVNNGKEGNVSKINFAKKNFIEIGDILKIDIKTTVSEVSAQYNNIEKFNTTFNTNKLILDGYKEVDEDSTINYPIIEK